MIHECKRVDDVILRRKTAMDAFEVIMVNA